jgi:hypothetical protein
MRRYVIRRKLLPVASSRARRQLVELAFHDDPDVAQLAALELLDRTGRDQATGTSVWLWARPMVQTSGRVRSSRAQNRAETPH